MVKCKNCVHLLQHLIVEIPYGETNLNELTIGEFYYDKLDEYRCLETNDIEDVEQERKCEDFIETIPLAPTKIRVPEDTMSGIIEKQSEYPNEFVTGLLSLRVESWLEKVLVHNLCVFLMRKELDSALNTIALILEEILPLQEFLQKLRYA